MLRVKQECSHGWQNVFGGSVCGKWVQLKGLGPMGGEGVDWKGPSCRLCQSLCLCVGVARLVNTFGRL